MFRLLPSLIPTIKLAKLCNMCPTSTKETTHTDMVLSKISTFAERRVRLNCANRSLYISHYFLALLGVLQVKESTEMELLMEPRRVLSLLSMT